AREGEFSKRVGECHSPTRSDTPKQGGKCPPVGAENVMLKICSRFRELGGRMCTIGSDAHVLKNVGYGAKIGAEIADAAGLAVVHYKERKPIRCG
ncbi:MAG: hypothetical protein FWF77_00460, partial [Defluviitaleaceae bacterium]|nr:hypothetical protein [Defluviitaleaceae bacterium]